MALTCSLALAGSVTAPIIVTAYVPDPCAISTSPLNFGSYDPLRSNKSAPLDGTSTLVITCTTGASASIGLDRGLNSGHAVGTSRALASTSNAGSFLSYEVYQDPAHTKVWGNSGDSLLNIGNVSSTSPLSFTAYAVVPADQSVAGGYYVDRVTATVNF